MDNHRRNLLIIVGFVVVLTGIGMFWLWPPPLSAPASDQPATLIDGRIVSVELFEGEADPYFDLSGESVRLEVDLLSGPDTGLRTQIETPVEGYPTFEVGDRVKLTTVGEGQDQQYLVSDFQRGPALITLTLIFMVAVIGIGGWHGVRSLVGLALSLGVVVKFIVPGIIAGQSPVLMGLVGGVAVMLVTLYLAHGVNAMTTAAIVGTAAALVIALIMGGIFVEASKLTGYSSEDATLARFVVGDLDLKGLVLAGLIIAALGVLDDVTVTQSSTVFALRQANPSLTGRELFSRGMRVGRDHIASTVNTLFLAYTGASLALLVLFSTGGLAVAEILNSEILAEEIVKTMVGSLGLISAVPITTALAASLAVRTPPGSLALFGHGGHSHGHGPDSAALAQTPTDASSTAWARYLHGLRSDDDPEGEAGPADEAPSQDLTD